MAVLGNDRCTTALVVGAGRGIGLGFVQHLLQYDQFQTIYATYRDPERASGLLSIADSKPDRLVCLSVNPLQDSDVESCAKRIKQDSKAIHLIVNCVGILQEGSLKPEKSVSQIQPEHFSRYFEVNTLPTGLLAKHFLPLFRKSGPSVLASISAKIGSIGDNRLGGWYGYRASKAALNMLIKTIAIEYKRKSPETIAIALHPGTTDTDLSKPFQANVPPEKLFSVDRTVSQLLAVIDQVGPDNSGEFFNWDGNKLPW